MERIRGLKSGMVMQRELQTNACKITILLHGAQHPQVSLGKLEHLDGECYPCRPPYPLRSGNGRASIYSPVHD